MCSSHAPMPQVGSELLAQRFWSKVRRSSDEACWPWTAFATKKGYGRFSIGGRGYNAQRVAYWLATVVDPGDRLVCHMCDNPICCNPNHLFLGTEADNTADRITKGRPAGAGPRGARNGKTPLTEADIKRLWQLHKAGLPDREIGERLGVARSTVCHIRRGRTWSHISSAVPPLSPASRVAE